MEIRKLKIMQMNKRHISYIAAAAAALVINACVKEQIEKAPYDSKDCMGVYFVEEQENAKTHTLEKGKDKTELEFKVRRTNTAQAVEIPYEYSVYKLVQMPASDTSYMEVPVQDLDKFRFAKNIVFQKGQRETSVKVSFEGLTTGETFRCSMSITDSKFVSAYSNNTTSISFNVQMFEWEKLQGNAIYRDAFFSDMFDWEGRYLENADVEIYQRKDKKGYYRLKNVYTPAYLARLVEGDEEYEKNLAKLEDTYSPYLDSDASIYVDATDSSKVYFPAQKTGFKDGSLGEISIASDVPEVFGASSNLLYGTLSKDGVITFPKNGVLFGMGGYYYFSNSSGKFRIVLPGGKAEDYTIGLKAEEVKQDGNSTVTFTVAKDVRKIRYQIFEGKISQSVMATYVKKVESSNHEIIPGGELEIEKELRPFEENAKTGIYTLIACTFGDGDVQYREYSSVEIGYVKPGDDRKVEIFFGVHTDDRLASDKKEENYSSQNSFQYWVRGKNITHAQISYYPTTYYQTYESQIKEQMASYGSVNSLTLKMLNQDGLSGIVGNTLKAGTNYTFVVYAGNGYYSQFFTDTLNTRGVQDLMQKSYYSHDIMNYSQPSVESYNGEWIPVSVDIFDSKAEGRSIRGNWRASEVTLAAEGDILTVKGLFPALKTNPDVKFEIKDGLLYTMENRCGKVMVKDSTNIVPDLRFEYQYIPKPGALSGTGYFYEKFDDKQTKERRDMMMGGFVHEDIIAFVDNTTEFQFWALVMGGYQKNRLGEENLSTVIGDAHGELILVRKGSELLKGLMATESQAKDSQQTLSSLTEAHRIVMPEINSIIRGLDKADIAHELLELKSDVKVRSVMEY